MSRSMRSFVTGKTINKQVQFNNRLTLFTNPPIQTGDLYVTRDLYVARNTHLNNLDICGNLTVTGNTFLNYLDVSANADISGNLTVTGNTFLNYLDVSANADISGNLTVTGNMLSYGTISATKYLPGQVVYVDMLDNGQLEKPEIGNSQVTAGTQNYRVFTYDYTPKIATSYILIEYQTIYTLIGANGDAINAYLQVNGETISTTYQLWNGFVGGGTRSGTIFPIVGRYMNSTTTAKTIRVYINNNTDGDTITVNGDNSTWLKITEIGRNDDV